MSIVEKFMTMEYGPAPEDPREALEKLYAHFGWQMSETFRERLTAATQKQKSFKSKHEYTLEEFGLTKEWIQQELGPVLDFYSLPR